MSEPKFWEPFTLYESIGSIRSPHDTGYPAEYYSIPGIAAAMGRLVSPIGVVYPEYKDRNGVDELLPTSGLAYSNHVGRLFLRNKRPEMLAADWMHAFIWGDGEHIITDVWSTTVGEDQYPQTTIRVFRGFDEVDPCAERFGHLGAETIFAMGLEEQYRRRIMDFGGTIAKFLTRDRANAPDYPDGYIACARLRRR